VEVLFLSKTTYVKSLSAATYCPTLVIDVSIIFDCDFTDFLVVAVLLTYNLLLTTDSSPPIPKLPLSVGILPVGNVALV